MNYTEFNYKLRDLKKTLNKLKLMEVASMVEGLEITILIFKRRVFYILDILSSEFKKTAHMFPFIVALFRIGIRGPLLNA